jgi:hypothetical protein
VLAKTTHQNRPPKPLERRPRLYTADLYLLEGVTVTAILAIRHLPSQPTYRHPEDRHNFLSMSSAEARRALQQHLETFASFTRFFESWGRKLIRTFLEDNDIVVNVIYAGLGDGVMIVKVWTEQEVSKNVETDLLNKFYEVMPSQFHDIVALDVAQGEIGYSMY